ncbi:MAG: site-specific integrase [Pseudomonadota bacterium]
MAGSKTGERQKPIGIYKHAKSPNWQYDFQLGGVRFSGSTRTTVKREALSVLKEKRAEAERAIASQNVSAKITINAAAARYWREKAQFLSDADDLDRNLDRLVAFFGPETSLADAANGAGGKHLSELIARRRGETVGKFKKKPVSNATVNRDVIDCFQRLVNFARNAWALQREIARPEFGHLRLPETRERVRELSAAEEKALIDAIRADYVAVFTFAKLTGMRLGAVVGLTWPQIDLPARRVRIKVKDRDAPERWETLPLTAGAADVLQGERGRHETKVFTYIVQNGPEKGARRPMTRAGLRMQWDRTRETAGVEDFRWHDLRHDFATKLLRNAPRSNLKTVQRALAHKSPQATWRYAHVDLDDVAAAMNDAESARKLPENSRKNTARKK